MIALRGDFNALSIMKFILILTMFINFSMVVSTEDEIHKDREQDLKRKGRLISLFNVVQFQNSPCVTTATLLSGDRRGGTCFTSTECQQKGGSAQGSCASGFGVCCLFVVSASGGNVLQNCTYIQNPGFPSQFMDSTSQTYTINRCGSDVCYLRLDFETFSLLGVGVTGSDGTNTCQDQFQVMVSSGQTIPTICGENSGQHMFVDLGEGTSNTATLSFNFAADNSNKQWDIKVTQYKCGSENAPSNGCLQYHTGLTGRITTYNFDLDNDNHLPDQEYSICIRQENGYCCIQYTVCPDETNPFTLSTTGTAMQDTLCATEDFIQIAGSSSQCSQTFKGQLTDRYCGNVLSDLKGSKASIPICDCTPPFIVGVFTNDVPDFTDKKTPASPSRGICLDYTQIPCTG